MVKPIERPKSTIVSKTSPEENQKKSQKLLLTWLVEEPHVYAKIKKYISIEDFTDELYKSVAEKLFADLETGEIHPAAIISMYQDEADQNRVAELFNTKLVSLETAAEKEKAFHDIVYGVKKNSFEYYSERLGTDMNALNKVIQAKKDLEELAKVHFSLY